MVPRVLSTTPAVTVYTVCSPSIGETDTKLGTSTRSTRCKLTASEKVQVKDTVDEYTLMSGVLHCTEKLVALAKSNKATIIV